MPKSGSAAQDSSLQISTPATRHAANKRAFGATPHDFEAFRIKHNAFYARSKSAGHSLDSLNDHDGVLVIAGRDGKHIVAERFVVVKDQVGDEDRLFIKGYGDRAVDFNAFRNAVFENGRRSPSEQAEHDGQLKAKLQKLLGSQPWESAAGDALAQRDAQAVARVPAGI